MAGKIFDPIPLIPCAPEPGVCRAGIPIAGFEENLRHPAIVFSLREDKQQVKKILDNKAVIILALLLLMFLLRSVFFGLPLLNDEGMYGYVGQRILEGDLPYRDVEDNKPPILYFIYAAALFIFGNVSERGIRIFAALFSAGTLIYLFLLAELLFDRKAALISSTLFAALSSGMSFLGWTAEAEIFMTLPLMATGYFFFKGVTGAPKEFAKSGLALGAAFFIKSTALAHLLFLLPYVVIALWSEKKRLYASLAYFSIGFASVALAVLFYLLSTDTLADFIKDVIFYNMVYVSTDSSPLSAVKLLIYKFFNEGMAEEISLFLILAVSKTVHSLVAERTRANVFSMGLLLVTLIEYCHGGKFFAFYLFPAIPVLLLISGETMRGLWDRKDILVRTFLIVVTAFMGYLAVDFNMYFLRDPGRFSLHPRNKVNAVTREIALSLREKVGPGDYVYNWGVEWELYFYFAKKVPIVHLDLDHLYYLIESRKTKKPAFLEKFRESFAEEIQTENIRKLSEKPPIFFIISNPRPTFENTNKGAFLFQEMEKLVHTRYKLVKAVEGIRVYQLLKSHD
ncbi:MAG: glycosyltransferase family 39 protein [Armatimonadetes bacterium]|nr:glycosyltransferase family 39 protein [Armatimonadota bacterium]